LRSFLAVFLSVFLSVFFRVFLAVFLSVFFYVRLALVFLFSNCRKARKVLHKLIQK
jgi:hypothetical protein